MSGVDSRKVLWSNVLALMVDRLGGENLSKMARECGFAQATSTRLKKAETSVGLEIVDAIAHHFQVETWQLLVPGLHPKRLPLLMPSDDERTLYMKLLNVAREFKDTEH